MLHRSERYYFESRSGAEMALEQVEGEDAFRREPLRHYVLVPLGLLLATASRRQFVEPASGTVALQRRPSWLSPWYFEVLC